LKLSIKQLDGHLKNKLASVYLLSGDEPLQMMESADAIREAAKAQGFIERQVMYVETGFDWSQLQGEAASMSLFAERKVLDLRMPTGKPGREGGAALKEYTQQLPEDNILLIQTGKLDKNTRNTAWVKALEHAGVSIQVWDLHPAETLRFVTERLQRAGFQPDRDAVKLLTERVEGNLLAAVQEIEKLRLLHKPGVLGAAEVIEAVPDSSRHDPFELVDAALIGDAQRCIKILSALKGEGIHESIILWALSRDLRSLANYVEMREAGHHPEPALVHVWAKRKILLQKASHRHPTSVWQQLLKRCVALDHIVKGLQQGNAWDDLLQLTLWFAGEPLFDFRMMELP
jgi:DNA polymerase-3 subunit delta